MRILFLTLFLFLIFCAPVIAAAPPLLVELTIEQFTALSSTTSISFSQIVSFFVGALTSIAFVIASNTRY